jgi:hypothetical protein
VRGTGDGFAHCGTTASGATGTPVAASAVVGPAEIKIRSPSVAAQRKIIVMTTGSQDDKNELVKTILSRRSLQTEWLAIMVSLR